MPSHFPSVVLYIVAMKTVYFPSHLLQSGLRRPSSSAANSSSTWQRLCDGTTNGNLKDWYKGLSMARIKNCMTKLTNLTNFPQLGQLGQVGHIKK